LKLSFTFFFSFLSYINLRLEFFFPWELMKLRMELMSGQVFEGWREGLIKFAPTYKYCLNSNVYFGCVEGQKGGKRRAPAW
jgi:hypothetical protein